ncbi:MAG: hypothetical protein RR651_01095 [Lysinibacillus sp.]
MQQLLDDAVTYDEPFTAHMIYYMNLLKKINLNSPAELLQQVQLSKEEQSDFHNMLKSDLLQMRPIKIFAVQVDNKNFAFYFAREVAEAKALHTQLFKILPTVVYPAYEKMIDRGLYFSEIKKYKSFRELLQETIEFPKYICTLESSA